MTDKEKLACLTDRPCQVCKHKKDNGCCKWSCVFEEESESAETEKIRAEVKSKEKNVEFMDEATASYNSAIYDVLTIIDKHIGGR